MANESSVIRKNNMPSSGTRITKVEHALLDAGYRSGVSAVIRTGSGMTKLTAWLGVDCLIVQEYSDDGGVEVYAPISTTNSMDDLIKAIKDRGKPAQETGGGSGE